MKRYLIGCVCAVSAFGCAVESGNGTADGANGPEAEAAVSSQSGRLLAEIVLEKDHRVQFIETASGSVTIAETGFGNPDGALVEKLHLTKLREIYDALAQRIDPEVQARLDDAQKRVDALNLELTALEAKGEGPSAEPPSQASGARPSGEDVASQAFAVTSSIRNDTQGYGSSIIFNLAWCNPIGWSKVFCLFNATEAHSGWIQDLTFIRTVIVNLSDSGNANAFHSQYVCVSSFPIIGCTKRDWRTLNSFVIGPHQYGYFTDTFKWTQFSGTSAPGSVIHMATGYDF